MPIRFIWQSTSRGTWSPSIYHGEPPRDVTSPANAHLYRAHTVAPDVYDSAAAGGGSTLDALAKLFPPPPPEADEPLEA